MYLTCLTISGQTREGALSLFPDEVKTVKSPIVYAFLERYLYEVSQSKRGYDFYQRMAEDKVVVRDGSLNNIGKLSPSVPFTITRYEDKGYDVCWSDTTGNVLLSMQFPIQYELLLGKKKDELERAFKDELQNYSQTFTPDTLKAELTGLEGEVGILQPATVSHYYVKSLNTGTYYSRVGGRMEPIYDSTDKWHSAANLFQGVIDSCSHYTLHVEQTLYGFQKQTFTIGLPQWLNYCKENRLTVFFGIEEERQDGLKALLIAQNRDLGLNHMFSIILPDNFVEKQNAVFKVMADTYIRTDNIEDLYYDKTQKEKDQ